MPVTLAIVGAGLRGIGYAREAVRAGARVVAVAEPDAARRAAVAAEFAVPPGAVFTGWRELTQAGEHGRLADAVVIATQDHEHAAPAIAFAEQRYDILLEKPLAPHEPAARAIIDAVERHKVILAVCHVMRYSPYSRRLKEIVDSGRLGTIAGVQHLEPVGWWHQAHSFVRGNWRRADTSGPMLLTKSCHDLDWLLWVIGAEPRRVASFGSLFHFRAADRPAGAADRCTDCAIEPRCPYSAVRLYQGCLGDPSAEFWPLGAVTTDRTPQGVLAALRTGPYGRCVYAADNDVVDQQVVMLEFDGGATASFTMTAFTPMEHRKTRIFGTHGYLEGDGRLIRLVDFRDGTGEHLDTSDAGEASAAGGHGGGDAGLVRAFVAAVDAADQSLLGCTPEEAIAGHRLVWAAETARETGTVITL